MKYADYMNALAVQAQQTQDQLAEAEAVTAILLGEETEDDEK